MRDNWTAEKEAKLREMFGDPAPRAPEGLSDLAKEMFTIGTDEAWRCGLIPRGDRSWLPDAGARAAKMWHHNQQLAPFAVMLACCGRYAIDYLDQAPIFVVALAGDHVPKERKMRHLLANRFKSIIDNGPKLRTLFGLFQLPIQYRVLRSGVLNLKHMRALKAIAKSGITPSQLAQAIPAKKKGQKKWVDGIRAWELAMGDVQNEEHRRQLMIWGAIHVSESAGGGRAPWDSIADLGHFAGGRIGRTYFPDFQIGFDVNWTWAQAQLKQQEWHLHLRDALAGAAMSDRLGDLFENDYAPEDAPADGRLDHYEFIGLRNGRALFEEGAIMRHCVADYADRVLAGQCVIFSVRDRRKERDGTFLRVATVELRPAVVMAKEEFADRFLGAESKGRQWTVVQLRAAGNHRPLPEVAAAVAKFFKMHKLKWGDCR